MTLERAPLLADEARTGAAWCEAHSQLIDAWLSGLLEAAADGTTDGVALVAVGGYGRAELCPQSDIDVMLVHRHHPGVERIADRVWYPIWDEGLHLGHSVCTVREALGIAADDLDTATALLSARHIAGDPELSHLLGVGARGQWEKRAKRWLTELGGRVELRHEKAGEVAFQIEPDLKEGRGGLRDVHALHWAEAADRVLLDHDAAALSAAYAVLLDARVELQRRTGRASNALVLQEQAGVAAAVGAPDADSLMAGIAEAARLIAWTSDDTWRRIRSALRGPLGRVNRRTRSLTKGIHLRDGEVAVDPSPPDACLVLRAAVAAARASAVIDRPSLERLSADAVPLPDPWPSEARSLFVELLLTGSSAIRIIESLDQRGAWTGILPEWLAVRSRPQHNPYHRYTVDRHLLEAVANAARLAGSVERPDLLVVGALLHDLGKGSGGDHTPAGMALAKRIGSRMGYSPEDVDTLVTIVEHHLLLPEVATRRDLDDPTTIERVAKAVGSPQTLGLLAALTEADGLATGPSAWGPWKAELVDQLVDRVGQLLEGRPLSRGAAEQFPTSDQLVRLARPGRHIEVAGAALSVMTDDRPGIFSRVAGVLALHGLDVLAAAAHSTDSGRALAEFRVSDPVREQIPWARVVRDLELVLDGRLALNARLSERAEIYRRRRSPPRHTTTAVRFDDDASTDSTVIDVHTGDGIGVLYRITRALTELDLDIRSAKVQTLGHDVVDAFYVRDAEGRKIGDPAMRTEIERAIIHSIDG